MSVTLLKLPVALLPGGMPFSGSVVLFFKGKAVWSSLQLIGAGCLVVIVLTHVCEALHLFSSMHWGLSMVAVITSFPGALFLVSVCFP